MKRSVERPVAVSEQIDRTLRELGAQPDLVPLAVLRAWPGVVGAHAAQKTQPVRFWRGRLTVHATSEVWVTELLADADSIVDRLSKAIGRRIVAGLQVRVGEVLPPGEPAPPAAKRTPGAVPPEIEALLSTVDDPDLRESIRRAVGLSLGEKKR